MDFTIGAIKEKPIRHLLENSLEIIGICSSDGTIQYASPAVTRIAGYTESEPVGRNFSEFVHPEDLVAVVEAFRAAQEKDGVSKEVTCRYRHKNGAWYWAECVWTSHLCDPKIGAVIINLRDVTARKTIDTELNRSRIELRALAKRNQTLVEDESKRLSIEMHDRMGQSLTALKLAVISLEQALKKEYGADCLRKLGETLGRYEQVHQRGDEHGSERVTGLASENP